MFAAAGGEKNSRGVIAPLKEIFARRRDIFQAGRFAAGIAIAVLPEFKIVEELRPVGFGFADEDDIGMDLRLIREQGYVWAPQHHRNSATPKLVCHAICVRGTRRVEGDGNQIGSGCEIDRFYGLIDVEYVPMRGNEGCQIRHGDLLEIENARTAHPLHLG